MVSRVTLPPVPAVDNTSTDKRHHAEQSAPQKSGTPGTLGRLPSFKGERGKLLAHIERGKKASGARSKEECPAKTGNAGFAAAYELIKTVDTNEVMGGLFRYLEEMIGPQATPTQAPAAADLLAIAINWLRTGGLPGQENDNAGAHDTSVPGVGRGPANEVGKPEGR